MAHLQMHDMQGLLVRGYEELTAACFVLLRITDPQKAKEYLHGLSERITPADKKEIIPWHKEHNHLIKALHVAFTNAGLQKLGFTDELKTFSTEFQQGMTDPNRSVLLGDLLDNDPRHWEWSEADPRRWEGSEAATSHHHHQVDFMLMCYARNRETLNELVAEEQAAFRNMDIEEIQINETYESPLAKLKIFKEHFGFRDGISNPRMEGLKKEARKKKQPEIKAGEFVLGYRNEYGQFTKSPVIEKSKDPHNILPEDKDGTGKDLGKNGTYLVYRQMTQDVYGFWQKLKELAEEPGKNESQTAIHLAAKMVGRWPGGAPLVISPHADDPSKSTDNGFSYAKEDPTGSRCPFGAHIRRSNPRDQLFSGRDAERSKQMVRKHQIMRRGRVFGEPLVATMDPEDMLKVTQNDGKKRGLHFICLNSHISRQFEFIQNIWANNTTFGDLYNDVDPITCPRQTDQKVFSTDFTCQASPVRKKYQNIPAFTKVIGGAYFFMPGINALRVMAGCESKRRKLIQEKEEPNEKEKIADVVEFLQATMKTSAGSDKIQRRFHAKSLGLAQAEIRMEMNIPKRFQTELLKPGKTYKALVRFSDASPAVSEDAMKGVKGMSIKILNVEGTAFEKDPAGYTQDILLNSNRVNFPGKIAMQKLALKCIFLSRWYFVPLFLSLKIKGLSRFLQGKQMICKNVFDVTYSSLTPYLCGPFEAIKWQVSPSQRQDDQPGPEREAGGAMLDLSIVPQTDRKKEPIEDAAVEWKSKAVKVGTIIIPRLDASKETLAKSDESLLFSPWHCLPDHRPIGGVNRMRREVYRELALYRKYYIGDKNDTANVSPPNIRKRKLATFVVVLISALILLWF